MSAYTAIHFLYLIKLFRVGLVSQHYTRSLMAENGMLVGLDQSNDGGGGVNVSNGHHHDHEHGNEKSSSRLSEAAQKYMQDLLVERAKLENNFPLAVKLIDEGE